MLGSFSDQPGRQADWYDNEFRTSRKEALMTKNQNDLMANLNAMKVAREQGRHNLAIEREQYRSNRAQEEELKRANREKEALQKYANYTERQKAVNQRELNLGNLQLGRSNLMVSQQEASTHSKQASTQARQVYESTRNNQRQTSASILQIEQGIQRDILAQNVRAKQAQTELYRAQNQIAIDYANLSRNRRIDSSTIARNMAQANLAAQQARFEYMNAASRFIGAGANILGASGRIIQSLK